ncbi:MAG TPA: hypothetical protein DDW50_14630 [Firmicutes bacterium]|nr:hypothetical protein [Bacillota bacterium]
MVDPEIYRFSIVKLTLQPLVENAIYHGIKQSHGKCWVQIRGFRQDQEIYLEVIDNGAGMSQEKVQQIHDTLWEHSRHEDMGFGLSNVQQRIQLHYGSAYGLHIQSTVGGGTTIRVIIPAEKGDEKNVPYSHR